MKILNFGSCNIDYVYELDHIVSVGETEATDGLKLFPGGKGLNQSIALSKAGVKVYHAGCVGNDGDFLLNILSENGVDVSYVRTVDAKNGHAIIQVSKSGENSIVLYAGSNHMITKEQVDAVIDDFSAGDILLLQNEINNFTYIVDRAFERGMSIILNPSPCSGDVVNVDMSKIFCIVLNEIEAQIMSGTVNYEEALDFFNSNYPKLNVMLTLGSEGAVYQCNGERFYQKCFEVEAVDTTAAGDTITGYFISGLVGGKTPEEILKISACASAISVSRHGAAPSIPSYDEVMTRIGNMKERL